jgi:hypothetical protein
VFAGSVSYFQRKEVTMPLQNRVCQDFAKRFGEAPTLLARAPGRVNLIGEHTDYDDGFVLPMAIDRAIWIAAQPRDDQQVHVHSLDLGRSATFDLQALQREPVNWSEYIKGVAWALQEADYALSGWDGVMAGDVPRGAGLSSSAALELATARTFAAVSNLPWDPRQMALLGQRAENEWVGMNCGIMDQMISAAGQAGHALLIDCRSLETQAVPLPTGTTGCFCDAAALIFAIISAQWPSLAETPSTCSRRVGGGGLPSCSASFLGGITFPGLSILSGSNANLNLNCCICSIFLATILTSNPSPFLIFRSCHTTSSIGRTGPVVKVQK